MLMSLLPFVLIFVIMYFLILRPQQKRVKQHQEMVKNVRRGRHRGHLRRPGGAGHQGDRRRPDRDRAGRGRAGAQMRQMVSDVRAKGEPVKDDAAGLTGARTANGIML